ncbi:hypothetical protein [Candidatus Chlamydia sanziniae]|uniref:hypothetical protein n=1 Tax=Candidatus Chlamydia sanziniae TaxID=1806891 RepID=UPI00082F4176|nr:hypothetical protein [Candidatus Chlamydia sanziniae]
MAKPIQKPNIPNITKATARGLRLKTIAYLLSLKEGRRLAYHLLKRPRSIARLVRALLMPKHAHQSGNLFFYNCLSIEDIIVELHRPNRILILGFSYCEKPKHCPVGRFNSNCCYDPLNTVCTSCSIGWVRKYNVFKYRIVIIPTFIDIAKHFFDLEKLYPSHQILFVITACELSLKMFGDYASIMQLKGMGIRLTGRICNTFQAFKLAEHGVKPGVPFLEEDGVKALMKIITLTPRDSKNTINKKKNLLDNVVLPWDC